MTPKQEAALRLALKRAFNLGQTYWQQSDSEYTSQWKKADVTLASFNQLVEDTINEALAEQPAQPCGYPYCGCNSKAWCKVEQQSGLKQVIELYDSPEQPAQQEPDKYLLEVECTKCGATEKGVLTFTPQSKPWVGLTDEETRKINQEVWGYVSADHTRMWDYARAIEAKLREKNA